MTIEEVTWLSQLVFIEKSRRIINCETHGRVSVLAGDLTFLQEGVYMFTDYIHIQQNIRKLTGIWTLLQWWDVGNRKLTLNQNVTKIKSPISVKVPEHYTCLVLNSIRYKYRSYHLESCIWACAWDMLTNYMIINKVHAMCFKIKAAICVHGLKDFAKDNTNTAESLQ